MLETGPHAHRTPISFYQEKFGSRNGTRGLEAFRLFGISDLTRLLPSSLVTVMKLGTRNRPF